MFSKFIIYFFLAISFNLYSQIEIFTINSKSISMQLNAIGKPSIYRDFKIFGYAPLVLYKPSHYKNGIIYPKKTNDTEIGIAELSFQSIVNKNITEQYYLLVKNYSSNNPIVYISKAGQLDFSNNSKLIDENNKKYTLEIPTKKGITEFIIDYNQKLSLNLGFSEIKDSTDLIDLKYSIPIWDNSVKYGTYIFNSDTLCIALYDENHNGLFNEKNKDRIIISDFKKTPYIEIFETSSSALISDSIMFEFKESYFKIIFVAPNGNLIYFDEVNQKLNQNFLKIFDKVPLNKYINTEGNEVSLLEKFEKGKYFFVNLWINRCLECVDDLHKFDSLSDTYTNKINIVSLANKSNLIEVKKLKTDLKIKSISGLSNKKLNEELHLNGYPFGILFDKNGILIKKMKSAKELDDFLKTHD